jgi:hypothetical protein
VWDLELPKWALDIADSGDAGALEAQAAIFVDVLDACLSLPGCKSDTMWCFIDRHAWYEREEGAEGAAGLRRGLRPQARVLGRAAAACGVTAPGEGAVMAR